MLGFSRKYSFGENMMTGLIYLASADFIQYFITGQTLGDHLGTAVDKGSWMRPEAIPEWLVYSSFIGLTALAKSHLSKKRKRKETLEDITDDLKNLDNELPPKWDKTLLN